MDYALVGCLQNPFEVRCVGCLLFGLERDQTRSDARDKSHRLSWDKISLHLLEAGGDVPARKDQNPREVGWVVAFP